MSSIKTLGTTLLGNHESEMVLRSKTDEFGGLNLELKNDSTFIVERRLYEM